MVASELLYVTQVAPYRDGPAGVHGVLDQSATAMAELAEAGRPGLPAGGRRAHLDPSASRRRRGWWPCSPSGRRPGPRCQRSALLGAGPLRTYLGPGRPLGHRCLLRVGRVPAPGRGTLRRPPVDPGVHARRDEPDPSGRRPPRHHLAVARRGVHLLGPAPRRHRAAAGPARRAGPEDAACRASGTAACRRSAIPCPGASPRATAGSSRPRSAISPTPGRAPTTSGTSAADSTGSPPDRPDLRPTRSHARGWVPTSCGTGRPRRPPNPGGGQRRPPTRRPGRGPCRSAPDR